MSDPKPNDVPNASSPDVPASQPTDAVIAPQPPAAPVASSDPKTENVAISSPANDPSPTATADPLSVGTSQPVPIVDSTPLELPDFSPRATANRNGAVIDLLNDVDLNVKIELGRANMLIEDVLKLGQGSVVELDKLAGDPVDVIVNDRLVARGEVLILNDNFCVRISEIVSGLEEEVAEAGAA
jgi:flagellar motor switch protein FliN/FliY